MQVEWKTDVYMSVELSATVERLEENPEARVMFVRLSPLLLCGRRRYLLNHRALPA